MAKEKNVLFWLGAGVVQIDGKEYGADEPLPISKIPKATLDRWLESGKVGGKIKTVGPDAILKNLQAELAEAREEIVDLKNQIEALTDPKGDGKKDGDGGGDDKKDGGK